MIQTLIQSVNYNGRYIALKDFSDHTVVAEGATPKEVQDIAFAKGHNQAVITFIPASNMVQIY